MRIKEIPVYTFAELSDDAKEKARDWYRQGYNNDLSHEFEYLADWLKSIGDKNESKNLANHFARKNYNQSTVLLLENSLIESVEIPELDSYRNICKVAVNYNFLDDVLRHVIDTYHSYSKAKHKFLIKILDSGDLCVGSYEEINYSKAKYKAVKEKGDIWSKYVPANKASGLVESLNVTFQAVLEECKEDFQNYALDYIRKTEDWINSDEYIDEAITCNGYEFTENGKLA